MNAQPTTIASKPRLVLPTEKSQPKTNMSDYTWFIYGLPGLGKTTLASNFEEPLILAFEPGTKHLETYSMAIGCMDDVREVYGLLKEGNHRFKTVVFDTVDIFYRLVVNDLCQRRKIEHPSDEAYGKGSDMVKNSIYPLLSSFSSLGLGIVFISHQKEKNVKTRTLEYTKTTVSLSDSAANIFIPYCDIVGYCHFDIETQSKRIITFKGSDYLDAKARTHAGFRLPDSVDISYDENKGETSRIGFEKLKSYFEGERKNDVTIY